MEKETTKIAIIGAESTGKTYICNHLSKKYNTYFVKEYARKYLNELKLNYNYRDLEKIAKGQIKAEEKAINKNQKIIFFDTNILTIKIWSNFKYKKCSSFVNKHYKTRKYDLYIICNNDIKWQNDILRENEHQRDEIFKQNIKETENKNFAILKGTGTKRTRMAEKICDDFLKSKKKLIINE